VDGEGEVWEAAGVVGEGSGGGMGAAVWERKPRRMSLPLYRLRGSVTGLMGRNGPTGGGMVRTGMLHPLVHRNTSDLSEQRYSTTFDGRGVFPD